MVVGIQPRWPETGYGYIEFPRGTKPGAAQALPVRRFHEKPELANAKRYVAAGNFYWNSGMFFWRADVLLDQLRRHLPRTATVLASLPRFGSRRFAAALKRAFPLCENISIDYAVLEKAGPSGHPVSGIAAGDFGWNDVGSWNAVYELLPRRRLRQRRRPQLHLPGCAQQFRGCPRESGGAPGGAGSDRGGHAGRPAGGRARPRRSKSAKSSRRWRNASATICCSGRRSAATAGRPWGRCGR